MSPEHAPRRSQVVLVEPALSQPDKLTAAETHRLDRAIVAISINPELGTPVPDTLLRDYVDDVRVIYYVTALRQITIVASRRRNPPRAGVQRPEEAGRPARAACEGPRTGSARHDASPRTPARGDKLAHLCRVAEVGPDEDARLAGTWALRCPHPSGTCAFRVLRGDRSPRPGQLSSTAGGGVRAAVRAPAYALRERLMDLVPGDAPGPAALCRRVRQSAWAHAREVWAWAP